MLVFEGLAEALSLTGHCRVVQAVLVKWAWRPGAPLSWPAGKLALVALMG